MRLEVVIPAYNAAPFLRETLASLAAQTRPADLVTIVDDRSRDGTGELARTLAVEMAPRLRIEVLDKQTGRVEITAHNHGFAVDAPIEGVVDSPAGFGRVEVSHVGLNDNVVEGLRALDLPAFSVQYHPEAAAGPHDANYLFDRFRDLVVANQETKN